MDCYYFAEGKCDRGAECQFKHGDIKMVAVLNGTKEPVSPEGLAPEPPPDDSEGFVVVRPKKVTTWNTMSEVTDKAQYAIGLKRQNRDVPALNDSMSPGSRRDRNDFEIRMKNKFEPNQEVASLLRSGAEILPSGSERRAKTIPKSGGGKMMKNTFFVIPRNTLTLVWGQQC